MPINFGKKSSLVQRETIETPWCLCLSFETCGIDWYSESWNGVVQTGSYWIAGFLKNREYIYQAAGYQAIQLNISEAREPSEWWWPLWLRILFFFRRWLNLRWKLASSLFEGSLEWITMILSKTWVNGNTIHSLCCLCIWNIKRMIHHDCQFRES